MFGVWKNTNIRLANGIWSMQKYHHYLSLQCLMYGKTPTLSWLKFGVLKKIIITLAFDVWCMENTCIILALASKVLVIEKHHYYFRLRCLVYGKIPTSDWPMVFGYGKTPILHGLKSLVYGKIPTLSWPMMFGVWKFQHNLCLSVFGIWPNNTQSNVAENYRRLSKQDCCLLYWLR